MDRRRCCCPRHEELATLLGIYNAPLLTVGVKARRSVRNSVLRFFNITRGRTGNYMCRACVDYANQALRKSKLTPPDHPQLAVDIKVDEDVASGQYGVQPQFFADDQDVEMDAETGQPGIAVTVPEEGHIPVTEALVSDDADQSERAAAKNQHDGVPSMMSEPVPLRKSSVSGIAAEDSRKDVLRESDVGIDTALLVVTESLNSGTITDKNLVSLCKAVGKALNAHLLKDVESLMSDFKNIESLQTLQAGEWLGARSQAVVGLLEGMTAKTGKRSKPESTPPKKMLPIVHAYESLLSCRNSRFVGQFSFSCAIVKNTFRKSIAASDIDSVATASGSSTSQRNFLEANGDPKQCPSTRQ